MNHTKGSSSFAAGTTIAVTSGSHGLDRQYISHPLEAGGLTSNSVKVQLMCIQGNVGIEYLLGTVYVVSNDGTTKGDVHFSFSNWGPSGAYSSAEYRNKTGWDGDVGGNCTIDEGDRLVVELGHFCSAFDLTASASAKWGENAADLPENETQTTDGAGWIELSNDLTFLPLTSVTNNIAAVKQALKRRKQYGRLKI